VRENFNGKLRICIDTTQTINRAIRRPKYTIPTIKEKPPLLTMQMFSLFLTSQRPFIPSSWTKNHPYLPRFQGTSGHYCYTRMLFGKAFGPESINDGNINSEMVCTIINIAEDICVSGCGNFKEDADLDHDKNLTNLSEKCCKHYLRLTITIHGHKLNRNRNRNQLK